MKISLRTYSTIIQLAVIGGVVGVIVGFPVYALIPEGMRFYYKMAGVAVIAAYGVFMALVLTNAMKITCPLCKTVGRLCSEGSYTSFRCRKCGRVISKGSLFNFRQKFFVQNKSDDS
ncbi:MAG: hypothetical protein HN350_21060 [Phycisphaerales bacterium]|jgi:hypothetical protein|nr:hypothetical protein [Phycisphaerales bacterium]